MFYQGIREHELLLGSLWVMESDRLCSLKVTNHLTFTMEFISTKPTVWREKFLLKWCQLMEISR